VEATSKEEHVEEEEVVVMVEMMVLSFMSRGTVHCMAR
jgi:hypothetical protein